MHRLGLAWTLPLAVLGCSRPTPTATARETPAPAERPESQPTSISADALDHIVQIGIGHDNTCALRADGQIYCWGELPGLAHLQPRPRRVPEIHVAREIASGGSAWFAVERSGEVVTWGGLTGPHYRHRRVERRRGMPYYVAGMPVGAWGIEPTEPLDPALSAEAAAAAHPREVQLKTEPTSGVRPFYPTPVLPQWRVTARAVLTRLHTDGTVFPAGDMLCIHDRNGALSCVRPWFLDAFPSWNESQSRLEPDLVDLAHGSMPEVCMLERSGSVSCVRYPEGDDETWGEQKFRTVELELPGPAAAIALDSCGSVLLRDGRVVTWCDRNEDGTRSSKTSIQPDLDDATAIATGGMQTCVLRRDDRITCWYEPHTAPIAMPTPRTISTLHRPTQLAVGHRHACALLADGHVECWGGNEHGQLGNGTIDETRDEFPSMIPDDPPTRVVAPHDIQ